MRNPVRRNRNIGTPQQGYGRNNKLTIPSLLADERSFCERLGSYEKTDKVINGHTFTFITEEARLPLSHACTVNDVERMISYIPPADYGSLKFIVFRQPRRKEEIISPVWGRLRYAYLFEKEIFPAVLLESVDYCAMAGADINNCELRITNYE
ncbi:hypothetical protein [Chitinophaga solisilvae]|uniref:hypothetical protein n=1 Tax=Chitinophaga solisilvae TaxID=1233460 RepID=UPI00136FBE95|nr:hypothetical protein [Chitinophaga solisilvae]